VSKKERVCVCMRVCACEREKMSSYTPEILVYGGERERKREQETERGSRYGVATISRLLKMIGLFCRISSLL